MTEEQRERYIEALEAEKEGYRRSGKTDRIEQVDAEIARVSGKAKRTRKPKPETRPHPGGETRTGGTTPTPPKPKGDDTPTPPSE